jgi:hypothetical protein
VHVQPLHGSLRGEIVWVTDGQQLIGLQVLESEGGHPCCAFGRQTAPPELGVQTPAHLERIAAQGVRVGRKLGLSAGELYAARADDPLA